MKDKLETLYIVILGILVVGLILGTTIYWMFNSHLTGMEVFLKVWWLYIIIVVVGLFGWYKFGYYKS